MRLYLIRHGATKGNLEGRYVGRTDEELLPGETERLVWNEAVLPDRILVSPLKRCKATAYALFHQKEIEIGAFLRPLEVVEDFRETDFGAFEYKNYQELNGMPSFQKYIDSGGETAFPFGETKNETIERVCAAGTEEFRKLLDDKTVKCAAVVAHGGTLMSLLDRFSRPHGAYFDWKTGNGCGYCTELSEQNGTFVLQDIRPIVCIREDGESV